MQQLNTAEAIAAACSGRRFISAEFMYRMPPEDPRALSVFEYGLHSRLSGLGEDAAVLFICNSAETAAAMQPYAATYPNLLAVTAITNPLPANGNAAAAPTPVRCEWEGQWQRYCMTDRWSRIGLALDVGRRMTTPGYLIMPAHDAVWGTGLLDLLVTFSDANATGGLPAAVSPYTYDQHSPVPGVDIPPLVIDVLNTAMGRDLRFRERIERNEVQGFWGKMSLMPFAMCDAVLKGADTATLEDDLEIDHLIRDAGYCARALWIDDPLVYRQALPVFDLDGVRAVIERTLHYSLNIPATEVGASTLNFPLDALGEARALEDSVFALHNEMAEELIAECVAEIKARLEQCGASWVDWGVYRHVVRPGLPNVEVWRRL